MNYPTLSENPLVSVMMPAKNAEKYLLTTIHSVQAQTHKNWELILVDDGSTDDTLAIAQQIAEQEPRCRVYHIQHGGRGMARNECLKHIRGELIAVCDADDVSLPERFAKQIAYLRTHRNLGAVGSAWIPFATETPTQLGPVRSEADTPQKIQEAFEQGKMRLHNATVMMRAVLIERYGRYRPELRRAQDYEFFKRMHRSGVSFGAMSEPLLYYRQESYMHSARYFIESNLYIRYADILLANRSISFAEFSESAAGVCWKLFYRTKYLYYWVKMSAYHLSGK